MIGIVLNPEDMDWATRVGAHRNQQAIEMGATAAFERDKTLRAHILGAQAELAFCRMMGLSWWHREKQWETGMPDVDPLWEIRYSTKPGRIKVFPAPKKKGRAKYRFTDNPDLLVCHVSGRPPAFEVYGFIKADWVQQNRPLEDPGDRFRAAHFATMYQLTPINPGFHESHSWANVPLLGGWICLYCGDPIEEVS